MEEPVIQNNMQLFIWHRHCESYVISEAWESHMSSYFLVTWMVCHLAFIYHCSAPTLRACIKRLYCILLNNPHRTCNIHIHINIKAVPQHICSWTITILIVWRRKIFHNNFRNPPFSQVGPASLSATWVTGPGTWPRWKHPIFCPVSAHEATVTRSLHSKISCNGNKTMSG